MYFALSAGQIGRVGVLQSVVMTTAPRDFHRDYIRLVPADHPVDCKQLCFL